MKQHLIHFATVAFHLFWLAYSATTANGAERHDAVVKIICHLEDGKFISGSGVCVRQDGVILTAAHVVKNGNSEVHFRNAKYSVVASIIPPKEGVAVLKVQADKPLPVMLIARNKPNVGDPVWVMGYPKGEWDSFGTTVTTNDLTFTDDKSTHLTGVFEPVIFGTSGGPLVSIDWDVVGIASVSGKIPPERPFGRRPESFVRITGSGLRETGGMYLSLQHVKDAYERFTAQRRGPPQSKRILYAFVSGDT